MKMPRPDELRLGGTASETASSGRVSIISTSTRRKLKRACASSFWALVGRAAAIADAPQLMEVELVGFGAAAAAELLDRGQADGKVVALEREGARDAELGRLLDEPALVQPEQDLVGIVGRKETAALGGGGDGRALPVVGLDEDSVELGSLLLTAVDAQA